MLGLKLTTPRLLSCIITAILVKAVYVYEFEFVEVINKFDIQRGFVKPLKPFFTQEVFESVKRLKQSGLLFR